MEIKELNKTQLILLSLLITFIVSIATGIVTVSLMQQAPQSVPQTVNNVIQRTIEKVTTVQVPSESQTDKKNVNTNSNNSVLLNNENNALVSIYDYADNSDLSNGSIDENLSNTENQTVGTEGGESNNIDNQQTVQVKALGQGIIISDIGLVLVDSNILVNHNRFKVVLADKEFEISILKQFGNGFTVMKILAKSDNQNKEGTSLNNKNSLVDTN